MGQRNCSASCQKMMELSNEEPNNIDINDADSDNSNSNWKALIVDSDSKCHGQCYSQSIKK